MTKVILKRDFFAGGRRYRVRGNPHTLPDNIKPPSDADIVTDEGVVEKANIRVEEQARLSAKPKK